MSASVFTTITSFEMVGFRKNHEAVFHVVFHYTDFSFLIVIVVTHLNTTWVGPIPVTKDFLKLPDSL